MTATRQTINTFVQGWAKEISERYKMYKERRRGTLSNAAFMANVVDAGKLTHDDAKGLMEIGALGEIGVTESYLGALLSMLAVEEENAAPWTEFATPPPPQDEDLTEEEVCDGEGIPDYTGEPLPGEEVGASDKQRLSRHLTEAIRQKRGLIDQAEKNYRLWMRQKSDLQHKVIELQAQFNELKAERSRLQREVAEIKAVQPGGLRELLCTGRPVTIYYADGSREDSAIVTDIIDGEYLRIKDRLYRLDKIETIEMH